MWVGFIVWVIVFFNVHIHNSCIATLFVQKCLCKSMGRVLCLGHCFLQCHHSHVHQHCLYIFMKTLEMTFVWIIVFSNVIIHMYISAVHTFYENSRNNLCLGHCFLQCPYSTSVWVIVFIYIYIYIYI